MAAIPVPPAPAPASETAPLSEPARILNTFFAPSKTFTDLRRNASWWGPFLLMVIFSIAFVYVGGQKVGFRKIMQNQMLAQPKQQARLEALPPEQRHQQLAGAEKITRVISYSFSAIQLIILLII